MGIALCLIRNSAEALRPWPPYVAFKTCFHGSSQKRLLGIQRRTTSIKRTKFCMHQAWNVFQCRRMKSCRLHAICLPNTKEQIKVPHDYVYNQLDCIKSLPDQKMHSLFKPKIKTNYLKADNTLLNLKVFSHFVYFAHSTSGSNYRGPLRLLPVQTAQIVINY